MKQPNQPRPVRPRGRPRRHHSGKDYHVWLNAATVEALESHLSDTSRGHINPSASEVIRRALQSYLHEEANYWEAVFDQLTQTTHELELLHDQAQKQAESFLQFLWYFFLNWRESSSREERQAKRQMGDTMMQVFIKGLKGRLEREDLWWPFTATGPYEGTNRREEAISKPDPGLTTAERPAPDSDPSNG